MRPLHWTVLATHVPPGGSLGGIVRYTTELISALAAREDVLVSALTTAAAADTVRELIGPRAEVSTVPAMPTPLLSIAERYLPLAALQRGPDVVQGTKHQLPRQSPALRVLTIHDMLLLDRPMDFGRGKRLLLPASYRGSMRDADVLLCVTEATRERVLAHLGEAAADRIAVVQLATATALRAAPSRPIPPLQNRRFALAVGDSSPRKNLQTLMRAWTSVRAAIPDAVLAVVGPPNWSTRESGPEYDSLVAAGAVLALGQVEDAQLRWAYENTDLVLCPSLAEGFGLPAAEALDFGAPVLVSPDPALLEVCAGRALAVLPALDVGAWATAIQAALGRPARMPTVGANPSPRTWAEVAADTVSAVRTALDRRPAR